MPKNSLKERVDASEIHLIYAVHLLRTIDDTLHGGICPEEEKTDRVGALVNSTLEQIRLAQRTLGVL